MPRPRLAPGELGKVSADQHGGSWRARSRIRDGAGNLHQLVVHGETEQIVRDQIVRKAHEIWGGMLFGHEKIQTLAQLANIWLAELEPRVELGRLKPQSKHIYETSWRSIIQPRIGAVPLDNFDAGFVDNFLQRLELEALRTGKGASEARTARKILSLIASVGVRHGLFAANPVAAAQPLESATPEFQIYTPEQVRAIFELAKGWEGKNGANGGGRRPNKQLLMDMMVLILATSMRPGEALAIRRQDCTIQESRWHVELTGTIVELRGKGKIRQDVPKEKRQQRGFVVASFAAPVLKRALASYKPNEYDLLFTTSKGTPYSVTYLDKLFRSFRDFYADDLKALGIDPIRFIPYSFRKTHATMLVENGWLELAQLALGHTNSKITLNHYVRPNKQVPVEATDIIEDLYNSSFG